MKIIMTEGCVADNTTVDGIDVSEMTMEQYTAFIDKVLAKVRESAMENSIRTESILNLLEYDEYESDDEPCDQCGDHVSKTTWNI